VSRKKVKLTLLEQSDKDVQQEADPEESREQKVAAAMAAAKTLSLPKDRDALYKVAVNWAVADQVCVCVRVWPSPPTPASGVSHPRFRNEMMLSCPG
jgi:hypothetical protein